MSDTVKLIIEIPKEAKQAFDIANDLKSGYYDHGGIIGKAIQNGIPLDNVKAEIEMALAKEGNTDTAKAQVIALSWVLELLDNIGKAESEVKPNE